MLQFIEFCLLLIIDVIFVLVLFLLMLPLIRRQAAFAVMKRNFVGYFNNPTGYVFLCIFVLLTSFAAFWPHEFFTTNLANFDQLNKLLPYIMLVFIPAITMSIWAEERRQGTDELLLSLPALDFDIVIGKYFAAVWVFTVSLLFSQLSNYAVLLAMTGGQLDTMLLFSTYIGYWFMGIAMISIGMVASFLTNNLTVGFIFGAAFNAPLAFFSNADVILSNSKWVQWLFDWSLLQRFEPFGRGLVSLSSGIYFVGIAIIGIYLSLVLIGRRHWLGGRDGTSLLWHYMLRAICLVVTVIAGVLIVQHSPLNRARMDISAEKVSTLSDSTIAVLDQLAAKEINSDNPPIKIEAYISNNIPTEYVQTKYDLVNLLREFDVRGGNRVQVKIHQGIEPFSEEAILAEKRFGIRPRNVESESRGAIRSEQVVLGAAFTCGLERVVTKFFPYGMPVEYELMRSINTVSQSDRKTVGVVETDAFAMGALLSIQGQQASVPRLQIIRELEKQYDVESVSMEEPNSAWFEDDQGNRTKPRYDVLLAIQPSRMSPTEMDNLIDVIQSGYPVAIFEDPLPNQTNFRIQDLSYVQGTFFARSISRNSRESADIQKLWDALDLDVDRVKTQRGGVSQLIPWLVWQLPSENPYPRDRQLNTPELVIVREENPDTNPMFSPGHPAMQGITELFFQLTGAIAPVPNSKLIFEPLVSTGELTKAGRILLSDFVNAPSEEDRNQKRGSPDRQFFLAAHIRGESAGTVLPGSNAKSKQNTNVIYVADMDTLADYFVNIRNSPIQRGIEYRFQNMAFVLNIIDSLANESTYLSIRNRKFRHVTLRVVEATTEEAMQEVYDVTQQIEIDRQVARQEIENKIQAEITPLAEKYRQQEEKRNRGEAIDLPAHNALFGLLQQKQREQQGNYDRRIEELQNETREKMRSIQLDAELRIQDIQRKFKLMAVLLPPIPPLLVGLIVFTRRRLREREGISKARRLK